MTPSRALLSLALAAVILWRNLPVGLLCLSPGWMRFRRLEGDDQVDLSFAALLEEELVPLGFRRLGTHLERPPLGRGTVCYDFVHEGEGAFATAFGSRGDVIFYLLTPLSQGGFVLTANHSRQGVERQGYLSGGIPDAPPEQLLPVHRRRVERLKEQGLTPTADLSMEGRLAAAVAWSRGKGVRETRLKSANAFILCLMGVVILIAVIQAGLRARPAPSAPRALVVPAKVSPPPTQEAVP